MLYTSVCFILGFVKFLNTLSLTFPVLGELLGHSFISKQISLWSDDYWCPCWNLVQFGTFVALVFSLGNLEVFTCWLIRPHFFFFLITAFISVLLPSLYGKLLLNQCCLIFQVLIPEIYLLLSLRYLYLLIAKFLWGGNMTCIFFMMQWEIYCEFHLLITDLTLWVTPVSCYLLKLQVR